MRYFRTIFSILLAVVFLVMIFVTELKDQPATASSPASTPSAAEKALKDLKF